MDCTLEIRDEVNIRFIGLDPNTRRKLKTKVEFFLPHARHTPAFKLGRWDGLVSYCDVGGRTYFHILDQLLPIVLEAGYTLNIDDQRTPAVFELDPIHEDSYAHKCWPAGHPAEGQPIKVRDYQVDMVNRYFGAPQSIQVAATGAGKTLVTAILSDRIEKYGRSVVIVPNTDLVTQTARDYVNLGLDVGVLYGGEKTYDKKHTICTWQSLEVLIKNSHKYRHRVKLSTEEKAVFEASGICWCCESNLQDKHQKGCLYTSGTITEFLDGVVCVIVDEVHKAAANVLKEQLTGAFANIPIRWGLTGTLPTADHDKMSCLVSLGPTVGELHSKELRDKGVLADVDVDMLQIQDGVRTFTSYAQELKWLTTDLTRISEISKIINEYASTGNTLVLIDRIATGELLAELNPDWVFISGATKQKDRLKEYTDVNTATNKVIVATYGIAAVGINVPRLFNAVLLEPGKSYVRVIQSIGRALRKSHDKDYARIVDISSNLKYSKRHMSARKKFYTDQKIPYTITKVKY